MIQMAINFESELYNNAANSIAANQMDYSEDERRPSISLASSIQLEILPGNIPNRSFNYTGSCNCFCFERNCQGISISTSWDRKVLETSLSSIVGTVSSEKSGLPAEEVDLI